MKSPIMVWDRYAGGHRRRVIRTPDGTWGLIPAVHERIGDGSEALRLVNIQLGGMGLLGGTIGLNSAAETVMMGPVTHPRDEAVVMRMWETYVGGAFLTDPTPGLLNRAMASANHGTLGWDDFALPQAVEHLRWHRDSMRTHWIVDWRVEDQAVHGFALHRPLTERFTDTDATTLRILCGHVLLAKRLETDRPVQEADAVHYPIFLIDSRMRVHHVNTEAERLLLADDGFRTAGKKLFCKDVDASTKLKMAVAAAAALHESPEPRFVLVPRRLTHRPYIAAITTVRLANAAGQRSYGARVQIIDTTAPPKPSLGESYRLLFNLTVAERRVAEALMTEGDALSVVALRCGISYHTVRTHVARLLAKTGTKGIPALVRLLSRLD